MSYCASFSGVFQKIYVDFWPLLKAEKVLPPEQFCFYALGKQG
jgi:hypothetical protein